MNRASEIISISSYGINIPITIPIYNGYIERSTVEQIMITVTKRVLRELANRHLLEEDK